MVWNIIAIVIAISSLFIVIYKEFIQGFNLHTSINQVMLMRLPADNKGRLLQEMILDDLLSDTPSKQANTLVEKTPELSNTIEEQDRDKLRVQLVEVSKKERIDFGPPDNIISTYWGTKDYSCSFTIPLTVYNSGKKFAFVSSLVLVVTAKDDKSKKWAFTVFVEINPIKLLHRQTQTKDAERVSGLFSGFAIGPNESTQIYPWFIPITDAKDKIISRETMKPGKYLLQVIGYSSNGKTLFKTDQEDYNLTDKNLKEMFSGTDSAVYLQVENHVDKAIGE